MMLTSRTDPIHIVSASDDRFAIPLGVMLTSLFENSPSGKIITVSVLDGGISLINREKILRIAESYHSTINFLMVNGEKFKNFIPFGHVNYITYYRLAIPELLDETVDKVLYLDCDLIIKDDITKLWAVDVSHHFLAAVEDAYIEHWALLDASTYNFLHDSKKRLNIPETAKYFNSGVMLINLSRWREEKIHKKIIDFVAHNPEKIRLADQDGLNALLFGTWYPLPLRWNVQPFLYKLAKTKQDDEYTDAVKEPYIIHYAGESKPWNFTGTHPAENEYFRYLALTEWNTCEISVILPALDEKRTIGECIEKIRKVFSDTSLSGEIIIVDSSTDGTGEIARSLGVTVIPAEKFGYGNAYLTGFRHAKGQFIIMGDSDNTYDFREIPLLLAPLQNGADLVIGSRFKGTIHPGSMTALHRYIGNPLLTWMVNLIFHTRFSDTHSGFRAITQDALNRLNIKSGGMEFASEMLIMASKENLRIEEVPINYYPRKAPSKLHSFADGWRHIRFVLLMKPLPFIAIPGLLFAAVGFLLMTFFFLEGDVESSHLHTFILGAIMMIGGLQVVLTALLMKTYSVIHGYEKKIGIIELFMRYHNLEKFLLFGALVVFIGILIGLNIFIQWISENFGFLSRISTAIISLVLITAGLQIFLFTVFQSMMLLNENNSSG